MYYSCPLKQSSGISQRNLYCYRNLKLIFLVRENFVMTTANARPSVQTSGTLEGRLFGRYQFNQNFRKIRSKTQWIGKVSKKLVHLWRWTTFPGMTGWKFWLNGLRPLREGKGVADIQLAIVLTKISPLRGSQSICALFF